MERAQRRGLHASIWKAGHPFDKRAPVQFASVATVVNRDPWTGPKMLVYIDEAHRCAAESYRAVLGRYPDAYVVGQTATPYRLDGQGLHEHFDALIECISPAELVAQGWLAEPVVYAAREPDLTGVRKRAGEYSTSQLEERMSVITGDIVPTWQRLAGGEPTVCFAVSIKHSKAIVQEFQAAGVPAAHIDGETPSDERRQVLEQLAVGRLLVVSNVDLLTEGWDGASYTPPGRTYRPLGALIAARPTASMGLWFQMVGRLTRPGARKVLLDHAGNTKRHGFLRDHHTFTLDGECNGVSIKDKWRPAQIRRCPACAAVWPPGLARCECGTELAKPREVGHRRGDLELLEPQGGAQRRATPAEKATKYTELVREGTRRRYKQGWASVQFKRLFGHWPAPVVVARVRKELGIKPEGQSWTG